MKKGFTLIEVLIVMVITVLMTTALVTNFSKTRSELPRTAVGVVNDIRSAQSRAVSGVLHRGAHVCGYGVHFELDRYLIFAGDEPDPVTGCTDDNQLYDPGESVLVQPLPAGLQFSEIQDVYFEPPLPTTYVDGVAGDELIINLKEPGAECPSAGCRVITINASGQIQTE